MASLECSGIWRVLVVWSMFFFAPLILTAPGVGALKFLKDPPQFLTSHVGVNLDINCTTDDPNATVSLLYAASFGGTWTEKPVTPNKLDLKEQVFTLSNLVLLDSGHYACKATDQSGQTIQSSATFVFINAAVIKHFKLIPDTAIYVLQGKDGKVTCKCKGTQIATLKWEKQASDDTSYKAVPNSWVTNSIDSSTNRVKAILKITNAQLGDSGLYKCTVMVQPDKSDFILIRIRVNAPTAPTIEPYKGETVIKEESTKVIECIAKGSPKPKVTWYRNGKMLNTTNCDKDPKRCENVVYEVYEKGDDPSGLHTIHTVQVLKIRSALYPRDQGEFKCVASNDVLPDAEFIINLDVQVSPKILEQKNQPVAKDGKEFSVSCKLVKGNPLPTFKWQYAFQNLGCDISDSNCFPGESLWTPIPPELMITPTATPTNESIVKVESHQESTFYRCQAFNNLGNDSQVLRFARLAQTPPTIIRYGGEKVIKEGSTKVVKCIAKGFPKPNVTWYRNNKKLSIKKSVEDPRSCKDIAYEVYEEGNDSSGAHSTYTIRVLKIRSVLYPRDHEEFKCVASNGILPDAELIIDFHVQVELADHLKLRPGKPIIVLQGQEAKVKCDSEGISAAKVQWKKQTNSGDVSVPDNMVTIVKDRSTNRVRAILKITFAQMQHSGVYKCVLAAFGRTDFKLTMVTVKESLAFLKKPPRVIQGYLGTKVEINCSTNDDDAAVSLLRKPHPFASYKERKPKANRIFKERQVFTILNLEIEDAGIYSCRATNRKNQTIQWPRSRGYFVLSRGRA